MNEVQRAVDLVGGPLQAAKICGVSAPAVIRWLRRGKLPRTEATGETDYAERLAKAHSQVSKKRLLETVRNKNQAA